MRSFSRISHNSRRTGFTLLEMLVTAAIIGIITVIVVVRYGAFNSSVLLKSQAYELALNLREAQVFAISVRGDASAFRDPYGLYFTTATPNQYLLFVDSNESGIYNTGEEIGEPFILDARFRISSIRAGASSCSTNASNLSVTFERPDFDARIVRHPSSEHPLACITIAPVADSSATRVIEIRATGQITVD